MRSTLSALHNLYLMHMCIVRTSRRTPVTHTMTYFLFILIFFNIVVVCLLICFVPTYFKILFGIQKQCDISSLIDSGNFVIFFPFFVTMCLELVISPSRMICWVDLPSVSMCHILPIQEER